MKINRNSCNHYLKAQSLNIISIILDCKTVTLLYLNHPPSSQTGIVLELGQLEITDGKTCVFVMVVVIR